MSIKGSDSQALFYLAPYCLRYFQVRPQSMQIYDTTLWAEIIRNCNNKIQCCYSDGINYYLMTEFEYIP